ncbi:MAG: 16S rRNA (cytosine(1402)-N(4))-methyltransferase RsmH [Thermodesulfobacteriota bacterium]|nr:16S rRNA (cytosine(1402)-N(4))-methyltransferase RsmH [Thermodesulfobacteriota bacterium]
MDYFHQPVMLVEAMSALNPREGGRYVDCTVGGGGHAKALLSRVGPRGRVLGVDRDPEAIQRLEEVLQPAASNLILRQANFSRLDEVLAELGWEAVDGMIADLGLSSYQLDLSGRGFSFQRDEPLDMRMDPASEPPASVLVNRLPEKKLADLIFQLGEDRASRRIARAIVQARRKHTFQTADQLADVVRRSLRRPGRPPRIDPATRTFQALRLAVNRELESLETFLALAPSLLKEGGRLVVISFHSLEDRLVKRALIPANRCKPDEQTAPALKALYKKPLRPGPDEVAANPRARSAKLRAGERI